MTQPRTSDTFAPRPTKSYVQQLEEEIGAWMAKDEAARAGELAHILTIGSPARGLCFRLALGRCDRRGRFHPRRPRAFFIWRGRRVGE